MHSIQKHLGLGLVLSLVCMLLFPSSLYAHAYLLQSTPSANEILTQSPPKITLQFNESIQPAFHTIQVTNSAGERVDVNESYIPAEQPKTLEGLVKPDLPDGVYVIGWSVISGDGHPIEGSIPFQIGGSSSSISVPSATSTGYSPSVDLIVIRWLLYLSMALFTGILSFYLMLYPTDPHGISPLPQRSRTILWGAYGGTALSIILSLPLQATIDARIPWSQIWTSPWLQPMMQTSFGFTWLTQMVMVVALGGLLYLFNRSSVSNRSRKMYIYTALSVGLGILLAKSFIGHSVSSEFIFLPVTMNFLHSSAVSIWIGSLLALATVLPGEPSLPSLPEDRKNMVSKVIQRFSCMGSVLVSIVIASGVYASLKYIPTWYALFHSQYGQVLLLKCGLVVIMLGFAAFNFIRGRQKKPLGRSIWIEFSLGIITLMLAAILTNLPPAMASPGPVNLSNTLENGEKITLQISPNVIGNNEFKVHLQDAKGQTITNLQQIKLTLTSLDMNMSDYEIIIPYQPDSTYMTNDLISMAGRWNIQVHILSSSLDTWDTDFKFRVGSE